MGQEDSKYFIGIDSYVFTKHYEVGPTIPVYSYTDENI